MVTDGVKFNKYGIKNIELSSNLETLLTFSLNDKLKISEKTFSLNGKINDLILHQR